MRWRVALDEGIVPRGTFSSLMRDFSGYYPLKMR